MFGKQINLFKLFGFQVKVDFSWVFIAVLIAWSLSTGLFPFQYKGFSTRTYWIMGIIGSLGLFLSIIIHEFSHSLAARRYGMHMKGITLFIFGGMAEMMNTNGAHTRETFQREILVEKGVTFFSAAF